MRKALLSAFLLETAGCSSRPNRKGPPNGGPFLILERLPTAANRKQKLFDLRFLVGHVLADLGVEFLHFHLVRMEALVLRRRVVVARASRRDQFDFFAHGSAPYTSTPSARSSATTASMPFFSIVRRPRVEIRRLTKRRSLSSQKRCTCKLGRKRRRRLLLACETRLPVIGRLPVI